jgi:hypothetical protein
MERNELTSPRMASLASRALNDPASLTLDEIRELGGSCLTQAPDKYDTLAKVLARAPGVHAVYSGNAWLGADLPRCIRNAGASPVFTPA